VTAEDFPIIPAIPPCPACGAQARLAPDGNAIIQHGYMDDGDPCPVAEAERIRSGNGHTSHSGGR
jgi:hypothetical protein